MVASLRRFVGSLCVHACTHPVLVARVHNIFTVKRFHESQIGLRKKFEVVRHLFKTYINAADLCLEIK